MKTPLLIACMLTSLTLFAQTKSDSLAIRQAALDYIESQHKPNPQQMERALHPRMVKRTSGKRKPRKRNLLVKILLTT